LSLWPFDSTKLIDFGILESINNIIITKREIL